MEIGVPAPVAGRVRDVFVARNVQVDAGAPLFRIEPAGDATTPTGRRPRIELDGARRGRAATPAATLAAFLLGFDVDVAGGAAPRWPTSAARRRAASCSTSSPTSPRSRPSGATRRRRRRGRRASTSTSYLRSLDLEREGLPAWFGER